MLRVSCVTDKQSSMSYASLHGSRSQLLPQRPFSPTRSYRSLSPSYSYRTLSPAPSHSSLSVAEPATVRLVPTVRRVSERYYTAPLRSGSYDMGMRDTYYITQPADTYYLSPTIPRTATYISMPTSSSQTLLVPYTAAKDAEAKEALAKVRAALAS